MPPTIKYAGKYPEKVGNITVTRYQFVFHYAESDDEEDYYFTTNSDCTAFHLSFFIQNPEDWIHIGTAVLLHKDYIKEQVALAIENAKKERKRVMEMKKKRKEQR